MTGVPTFRCSGYTFSVDGEPSLVRQFQEILGDLRSPVESPAHRWSFENEDGNYRLVVDHRVVFEDLSRPFVMSHAVSCLTRKTLDHQPEYLHLHALAVVDGSNALVAAGPSGSGKSTLCAALIRAGAAYLTDEAVAVDQGDLCIRTFPKPIVVKRYAIATVARLIGADPPAGADAAWELVASELGALAPPEPHRVATIASYRYQIDGPAIVEPIHRATLVHELLTDSPDAERVGSASLGVAARLVASARCLSASGADAAVVAKELLAQHREPSSAGSVLDVPKAIPNHGPARSAGSTSIVLDGRALVLEAGSGRLVELDETTTAWWVLLDGRSLEDLVGEIAESVERPAHEVHAIARKITDELLDLGLLTPATSSSE